MKEDRYGAAPLLVQAKPLGIGEPMINTVSRSHEYEIAEALSPKVCVEGIKSRSPTFDILANVQITLYGCLSSSRQERPYPASNRTQKSHLQRFLSRSPTRILECTKGSRNKHEGIQTASLEDRHVVDKASGLLILKWGTWGRAQMVREEVENCCRGSNPLHLVRKTDA